MYKFVRWEKHYCHLIQAPDVILIFCRMYKNMAAKEIHLAFSMTVIRNGPFEMEICFMNTDYKNSYKVCMKYYL